MQIVKTLGPDSRAQIVDLHSAFYAQHWGFGPFFKDKVDSELAHFADRACDTDLILVAQDGDGVAASLILDLNDPLSHDRGAHLRWFICADRCRGTGIGRQFMDLAVQHADQHCDGKIWLTTFAGLTAARHLYEAYGFTLAREEEGAAWGTRVLEQEFRR